MAESINRKNIDLDILDYYDGRMKDYVDKKVGTGGLTIDTELSDTSENVPQTKIVKKALDEKADKVVATTTADGLMSAEDKVKLDGADDTYALKSEIPTTLPADGGNADTVNGHTVNANVPENAVFTDTFINENLLINPDFKINQRGNTDFTVSYHAGSPIPQSQNYTVDRWRLMDGKANIFEGKFVLKGTIIQVLENGIGENFTATVSVESGTATASYDDSTKTFTIVGNDAVLNWAKLEYGDTATPFVPPDPATELLKCQRYYEIIMAAGCDRGMTAELFPKNFACVEIIFKTAKRVAPTLTTTQMRFTVATPTGYHAIVVAAIHQYVAGTDIFGMTIATDEPLFTDLPSDLFSVTADTAGCAAFTVDAEIY